MSALGWAVAGLPMAGAVAVALLRRRPQAAAVLPGVATAAVAASFAVALVLPWQGGAGGLLQVDALAAHMAVAVALAGMLVLWLGRAAPAVAPPVAPLAMLGGLQLALLADGPVLGWVGIEVAVLAVLLGARGREAAWRAAMAVLPALGMALLGGLAFWLAAGGARPWAGLAEAAPGMAPGLLSLGWMLLLGGLAVVAGLAPLHGWLRAAGRGGAAAALLPALAAAALLLLLRARAGVMAQDDAVEPGPPLLALGLASLAWAALGLWREERAARDSVLFLAGLVAVAFGLGGDAVAAGLVLLGAAVVLGPVAVLAPGRPRAAALAALALLPPFPTFGAALALLGVAADAMPWLAALLAALVLAGAGGLARAALAAWRAPAAVPPAMALPVGLVLAGLVASGMVPAASRWFELLAEGLR